MRRTRRMDRGDSLGALARVRDAIGYAVESDVT